MNNMKDDQSLGSSSLHNSGAETYFDIRPRDGRGLQLMEAAIRRVISVTGFLNFTL